MTMMYVETLRVTYIKQYSDVLSMMVFTYVVLEHLCDPKQLAPRIRSERAPTTRLVPPNGHSQPLQSYG